MLLRTTLCLLTALVAAPLFAQGGTPDTTTAARYFPLDVGNVWEYRNSFELDYERRTIAADTLIKGVRFVRYQRQALDEEGNVLRTVNNAYLRYDEATTELRYWDEGDLPPFDILAGCPLGAAFNSARDCSDWFCGSAGVSGAYGETVTVGDDEVTTSVKTYDTSLCEVTSTFAAGIGFTQFGTIGGGATLEYARVGDREYGEPRAVGVEPSVPALADLRLETFPNPAQQRLSITLTMPAAGPVAVTVYDVLGREVATLDNGWAAAGHYTLAFDAAALPGGVYVVRATAAGVSASQWLTVTR